MVILLELRCHDVGDSTGRTTTEIELLTLVIGSRVTGSSRFHPMRIQESSLTTLRSRPQSFRGSWRGQCQSGYREPMSLHGLREVDHVATATFGLGWSRASAFALLLGLFGTLAHTAQRHSRGYEFINPSGPAPGSPPFVRFTSPMESCTKPKYP